ncbi:histone acetyltransferases subunit 3-domain-containing protein [Crepidotus variabilis]|uniref:Histone acetyltransferases subunit 3-domain-containing protein n=1 Tax=Crepidotus variabilis TaxID=179855 RepID=A0A9P6EPN1_9AGAR|nr:histone acetyltransferases subunit 3-domain-containing protein [Crepidotus variabilis]
MASKLAPFPQPDPFRSSLVKNPPETVPSIDELEQLQAELKKVRQRAVDRRRKANEDLKTLEESLRRMTEKEKGKSKAVDKVKRERDYTPMLDGDDSKSTSSQVGSSSKARNHSHQLHSVASSSRSSLDPRKSYLDDKKKKKKRKREGGDSDVEQEHQRPRKMSPPPSHTPTHPQPQKIPKPTIPSVPSHPKPSAGPDFTLPGPHTMSLLPPRPPIPQPPKPGPMKPTDVTTDFSNIKPPGQVLVTTFYSSIEPYIRPIKEEDVGFLEYTGDEVEPYIMPKLGRHYLEVWEEQDMGVLPALLIDHPPAPSSSYTAPTPKWDPSTLAETDLLVEEKGHGPLTERVISALLPIPDIGGWKGVKAAEDAMEGRPGGSGAAAARKERLNVTDLEARIRDQMRHHGLIDTMPDFTERVDDPIATALREAQRELRRVVATNKARKARLAAIARDRLGYQEYIELRDSIDKNIATIYSKLQKKDAPKLNKKKRKPLQGAAAASHAAASAHSGNGTNGGLNGHHSISSGGDDSSFNPLLLPPCPAALGLSPDEDNRLNVHDQLKQLIETRRQWVDTVGSVFEEKEQEDPGRIYGLPKESVFKGIDEDIEETLKVYWAKEEKKPNNSVFTKGPGMGKNGHGPMNGQMRSSGKSSGHNGSSSSKGKEKVRGDAMDIG